MKTTRRGFLGRVAGGAALLAAAPMASSMLARVALRAEAARDGRILVMVQLSGGNDGLNTVVPFRDDAYHRARPTLKLDPGSLLKIDADLGFHPEMEALRALYDRGRVAVIQGVGYPASSRDHDEALRDWHTALPGEGLGETGWLGRTADRARSQDPASAPCVFVGAIDGPFAVHAAETIVPGFDAIEACTVRVPSGVRLDELARPSSSSEALAETPAGRPFADLAAKSFERALALSARLERSGAASAASHGYPATPFANSLATVARCIRSEFGALAYLVELGGGGIGGFDNHASQAQNHGALLRQLSQALAAFVADLEGDGLLDRVLLVTFSEFGRTVAENGRRGTDHGAAAPVFAIGGRVRGGILGVHPSLTDLDEGGMRVHTDFRRVFATALGPWLGLDAGAILGKAYDPLEVLS